MFHRSLILGCAVLPLMALSTATQAQTRYMTRTGSAHFVADGVIKDDVQARSNTVTAVLDASNGQVQARIPVNSFVFKKALMQEHFNENYLESHRFPNASFKGQIQGWSDQMLQKTGAQKIRFVGSLEIHGVARDINEAGTLEVHNGSLHLETNFNVLVAEYGIKVPSLVRDKIAKEAEVHVEATLKSSGQ
ncbi:MAG: YceI family protein [Bacteroidota bacterium]